MIKLFRIMPSKKDKTESGNSYIRLLSPAVNYITLNYNRDIKIVELAKLCNMSIASFRRTFRTAMKVSPSEYIYQFRSRMASLLLLRKETSILDVSIYVGCNSLSSFNRHFKRIMGMPPREWRKNSLKNKNQ